jgi:hypothetical protein
MKIANDVKIAKQFSRFGVWFLRGHLQFSYERHSGIENCSGKEFIGWIVALLREQSLTKPSTIYILILIPVRRQSDS